MSDVADSEGARLIAIERRRQIEVEGYRPEDDEPSEDLARAAAAYALGSQAPWPWPREYFKPGPTRLRDLEKAGALIAAAIDALLRVKAE